MKGRETLLNVLGLTVLLVCLGWGLGQNAGLGFRRRQAQWQKQMADLQVGRPEAEILKRLTVVGRPSPGYRIGILRRQDYPPSVDFGNNPFRVYQIGYYDFDGLARPLIYLVCVEGRIVKRHDSPQIHLPCHGEGRTAQKPSHYTERATRPAAARDDPSSNQVLTTTEN